METAKTKKRKVTSAVTAVVVAAVIALSGTFAWQSISQRALNETVGDINPGGRLHDDFDGRNKDVYVENFTDPNNGGVPIFARVRLDEYMEIGAGAGLKAEDAEYANKAAVPLVADTDINDPSTWTTHIPAGSADICAAAFHEYWSWDMGGQTVYMPTFNMNKDSLEADVNGTYDGTDATDDIHYDDYVPYTEGETKPGAEVWDADDNTVDEGDAAVEGVNIKTIADQIHTAKTTQSATVITMAEWKAQGSPVGKFWVYDTDGWAYWAEAIMPGEATGLLLNGINLDRDPDENWYYGINVVGQFATRGDWGQGNGTGFYDSTEGAPPSDDALTLLNKAADLMPTVTGISIAEGNKAYVKPNETLTLTPQVTLKNASGSVAETLVTWSIDPATSTFNGGTITPTSNMVGQVYRVTATSAYDTSYSAYADIYVIPAESQNVVDGASDAKKYLDYGDNTYKVLNSDGSIGDSFICAGADEIIGNADDKADVVVLETANAYGSKFLGPNSDASYWAMGDDGKLGTADDVKVWGDPWPNDVNQTNPDDRVYADTVTVTSGATTAKLGTTLQFNASVTKSGTAIADQGVTWTVINGTTGTSVNASGLLTISANETVGKVLTVRAESTKEPGVYGQKTVTVTGYNTLADISKITPGSTDIVTIDGVEFYVLAKESNQALLLTKDVQEERAFDASDDRWMNSEMRTYLNGTWLNNHATLKTAAVTTTLHTIQEYTSTATDETQDKVFLLSEADVFGTNNGRSVTNTNLYTYNGAKLTAPGGSWSAKYNGSAHWWWLRSPRSSAGYLADVYGIGDAANYHFSTTTGGVRPALWVRYQ